MSNNEALFERRKNRRFKVDQGAFVVFRPEDNASRLGSIIDISKGGLAFLYYLHENHRLKDFNELDIFFSGKGMYVMNIPVKIVSAIPLSTKDTLSSTKKNRMGVDFHELAFNKSTRLNYFIQNHTLSNHLPDDPA